MRKEQRGRVGEPHQGILPPRVSFSVRKSEEKRDRESKDVGATQKEFSLQNYVFVLYCKSIDKSLFNVCHFCFLTVVSNEPSDLR